MSILRNYKGLEMFFGFALWTSRLLSIVSNCNNNRLICYQIVIILKSYAYSLIFYSLFNYQKSL